ncbi:Protein CBG25233 [Caenorhabditis briggsae]|uniref:Protein CBG25233 n=1 Tax=Caenorhabditis briggsae TaxID=6238 RepID=B6IFK3_CAEBR|nr:Protein CBG25233 [Caenorhabditis briggsae]CAR98683.1 Protein CBG25233 [Caenorhabditis briggsae]
MPLTRFLPIPPVSTSPSIPIFFVLLLGNMFVTR